MLLSKIVVSLALVATAAQLLASTENQTNQRQSGRDFGGTWLLQAKKSLRVAGETTVVISQTESEIKITEKFLDHGTLNISDFTYYTDARGEENLIGSDKKMLHSFTTWKGNKLIIKFSPQSRMVDKHLVVNERVDEWSLSSDGRTLTQTISFIRSSPQQDASVNPYGSPRTQNVFATPLGSKDTSSRSFKRIA